MNTFLTHAHLSFLTQHMIFSHFARRLGVHDSMFIPNENDVNVCKHIMIYEAAR